jgi:hypothetical protein
MKSATPRAREESLIIKTLPDEVLVYDLNADKAHCLNRTAAFVWNNCDGRKTVSEIARLLQEDLRMPVDENVVWLALDQLEKFKLLQEQAAKPANVNGMSRRQMVRSLGLAAAVALPLITSIVAPTPAQAASMVLPGGCCQSGPECASGLCNITDPACAPFGLPKHCS